MSDLRQYLIDEFVEDYKVGHMSRRDALKRIAAITGSLTFAESLLAACAPAATPTAPAQIAPASTATSPAAAEAARVTQEATRVVITTTATVASQPGATVEPGLHVAADDPAIDAADVTFPSAGATLMGYLARPKGDGPFPAVLVCHENRGLVEHIKDVTRRVGKAGYAALAVDLLSRQGGTGKVDAAQVPGVLGNTPPDQFVQDFQAGLTYLRSQPWVRKDRAGMTGFCFGGGVTWRCATKMPELQAAVPYYGPNPPLEDVPNIRAAVLAFYGELDQRIDQGIPAIEEAMKKNNKVFEKVVFPNANHAFNNDTGPNYNAEAARDAWTRLLAWFEKYLKA